MSIVDRQNVNFFEGAAGAARCELLAAKQPVEDRYYNESQDR